MKILRSNKTFILLVFVLGIVSAINLFLPQGTMVGEFELPASKPFMAVVSFFIITFLYGGLGLLGIHLSGKLGFVEIWDINVTNYQRFIQPALVGLGIGVFFIASDFVFSQFNGLGHIPHPPFPTSLTASIAAAIGEEIIFRLFFISFWLWLISQILLKGKWQKLLFWIITGLSAITFAIGHLPSVMLLFDIGSFSEIPLSLLTEVILLNGLLSFFAAYFLKKFGFIAAVGMHFWADILWHVVFGLMIK